MNSTAACSDPEAVLSALAEPTRRTLLELIVTRGEATATEMAPELPVSRQAVVKHLGVLDRAGLVASRREGREVRFRVRPEPLQVTSRWLRDVADAWEVRLEGIREIAEG